MIPFFGVSYREYFHLKILYILLFIALFGIAGMAQTYTCLPSDVKEDDVVTHQTIKSKAGKMLTEKVTVKQTLQKLCAKCVQGKLVDEKGRSIRFYHLQGCWGNPPADYLEIMAAQAKEIKQLKKDHTVVEMTCQPEGNPPMRPY